MITAFLDFCQREVLRLLVNLSCNVNNLEGLLEFKVCGCTPKKTGLQESFVYWTLQCKSSFFFFFLQPLLILQTFMLPDKQDDIVLRAVTISANLLASPDQYTEVFWFSKNYLPPAVASWANTFKACHAIFLQGERLRDGANKNLCRRLLAKN